MSPGWARWSWGSWHGPGWPGAGGARWRSPALEALGLPVLALLAGMIGWLIDPQVRLALLHGQPFVALSLHGPGWIAAVAFWRGEVHRSPEDDDAIQDRLLRWAVPGLAIPWAVGHLATEGTLEREFVAAAFVGTVFFVASAFIAMGLARLEAVRATTGGDWRANRSWVGMVVVVALGVTLVSVPAAAWLDVPARSLMVALLGPLQAILLVLLVVATPIIVVAAAVADAIVPLLPKGIELGQISLPDFGVNGRQVVSSVPVIVFYVVFGLIALVEISILVAILWLRWQERKRMRIAPAAEFEERSIVLPPAEEPVRRAPRSGAPSAASRNDPVGLYLQALDALARDGRWTRRPHETPAGHAARARAAGLDLAALRSARHGLPADPIRRTAARHAGTQARRGPAGRAAAVPPPLSRRARWWRGRNGAGVDPEQPASRPVGDILTTVLSGIRVALCS